MTITILYFAAVREALKIEQQTIELDELSQNNVASLWTFLAQEHPPIAKWRAHLRMAVNQNFAQDTDPLRDGDEIAIIPPVSGGQGKTIEDPTGMFVMTTDPINIRLVEQKTERDNAGAVLTFTGRVRNHTGERLVDYLVYEAYDQMALSSLVQAANEAKTQWPDVQAAITHRYGRLEIGEAAVVIAVSSPHRADVYAASRYLIERLKEIVPIWKKEISPNGDEWVGMGP